LAAVRVVAFRLPDLADVLAFVVAFRLPDLAAGRVVAFRLPDLAAVLAFVVAFRLPDLTAGRVVAFRLPDLADVLAFFAVVLAIDCPFRLRLSRRSVRPALGGPLAVVAQCSHPAAQLNASGPGTQLRHATLGAAAAFCYQLTLSRLEGTHRRQARWRRLPRRRRCSRRDRQEPR